MTSDDARARPDIEEAVAFQRDLYLYWWAARELGDLALTSRGFLTRSTLRRLRALLPFSEGDRAEADDLRLYFLRRLLERLGLLRAPSEHTEQHTEHTGSARLVAAEHATMARFLAHPLAERLRICARLWVAGGWWSDGGPSTANASLRTPVQPRIALARRRLLETLAATEPGGAIEMPGASLVAAHAPRIIGATATRRKPRDIAEERNEAMRAALAGPLQWMGLVIRRGEGASGERRLVASHAALALRNEPDAPDAPDDSLLAEAPGRVVVQPNMEMVAYQPLTAPTIFTLDSCATRISLERVARYRLTQKDVARAQRRGWPEDEIVRRIETLAGSSLPDGVRVRLGDWARAANRVRLTDDATVLTTSAATLDALLADRAARGWVIRRLGPTLALVETADLEALRRWLLARGELPAVERAEP